MELYIYWMLMMQILEVRHFLVAEINFWYAYQ